MPVLPSVFIIIIIIIITIIFFYFFFLFAYSDLRYKVPDSQFKWIHFLESEQKYGMKCLYL